MDPKGNILSAQAERIEISKDGTIYTFFLKDTFWSDGKPVTAEDFRSSWLECLDPNFPCPNAYLFYPIKNAKPGKKGKIPLNQVGIEALNSKCLRVHLEKPNATFLSLSSSPFFYPIRFSKDALGSEIRLSNGPFILSQWKRGQKIKLIRNGLYRNTSHIKIEGIEISLVSDQNTAYELFLNGQLDFIGSAYTFISPSILEFLPTYLIEKTVPAANVSAITFNTWKFPFTNQNFRKALSAGIDRRAIATALLAQKASPAYSIIPDGFKSRRYDSFPECNLQEARKLLDLAMNELGITSAKDLPKLKLLFPNYNPNTRKLAQILQNQWGKSLGINIELETYDLKHITTTLSNMNYDIGLVNWNANYLHAISFLDRFFSKDNPKNYSGWENAEFQKNYLLALDALDLEMQWERIIRCENILAQEAPVTPIVFWDYVLLTNKRLSMEVCKSGSLWIQSLSIRPL